MRKYYIADTVQKVRLPKVYNTLSNASKACAKLNAKHPGRFQCGDWCNHDEVGKDMPREYRWSES